ncbi:MAG: hypothetical protein ABI534_06080 [Chloroflexota bacterium]
MRRTAVLVLALLSLLASLPAQAAADERPALKVAVIVGPVGEELTPTYLAIAAAAVTAAEAGGATVATAFSPDATPDKVLAAVEGANIVVYLGHGIGVPNPYGSADPAAVNGWGLQGPNAHGTHADSWQDGTLAYYGEAWIAANARPAPGWVMIYSNACYAPGASEGFDLPATLEQAQARVAGYARAPLDDLAASAYFATDFYDGAARLISTMLEHPDWTYGQVYAAEPNFSPDALAMLPDAAVAGRQVWLHHSPYLDGKTEYWYAFAGDPELTPAATLHAGTAPVAAATRIVTGAASSYAEQAGWEGRPTVALPSALGGALSGPQAEQVVVCADRCVELPIVDSCPCYYGTPDQRVANLSHMAWALVSDAPLAEGIVTVELYLDGAPLPDRPILRPDATAAGAI